MEGQFDRIPALVTDLVRRRVTVIAVFAGVLAAKGATTTIPIVFGVGDDPVRLGLVASLARPGGNLTGMHFFAQEAVSKRLGLLHEVAMARERVEALFISGDGSFSSWSLQLATLATRHRIAASFNTRAFAEVGGLMSYGPDLVHRFQSSNHIRRLDRVCKTTCGRPGPG